MIITAIAASGVFHFLAPVLADGTTAGTDIINQATATYSDGTTNFNAISNTVTIKVDEVRGLTVTDAGFTDANGGSIATSDNLFFDFLVTNTGNADAFVHVPGATALGSLATGGNITTVEIIEVDGTALGAPITVSAGGNSTNNLAAGFPNTTGVIPADGNFKVRVTMAVTATNAGDPVKVQFGTTADNTPNTQDQQNIPFSTDTAPTTNDVYTIDADGTLAPANGEREAAASHQEFVATAPKPLAQTTLLLTSTTAPGANANSAVDDTITYDLDFRVNNNPQPGFPAGSLEGTTISLDTGGGPTPTQRILVSTTVPPNTVWDGNAPQVPTGWTPVYSIDDAYAGAENPINGVTWTTTPPAPGAVKRIGFIYDSGANGALPPGTTVNDFRFTVVTSGLPATGGSVANIGQIFGETLNDPANNLVYDESGDQDANNYNDGLFPPSPDISDFIANPQTGAANPNDPDTNGNNSGTGPDGEANVIGILPLPPANSALLNGPNNVPNAIGPTNAQDDFTNAATTVPTPGVQGSASDPAAVTITNTVQNTVATNLDNVKLLPFAPDATRALTSGIHGIDRDSDTVFNDEIPDNTRVTIRFGGQTSVYTYTATGGFAPDAANPPVVIGTLTPTQQQAYTVEVNLPPGTPQIQGYTIPIVAFVDNDSSNSFVAATDTVYNFTNNRVYPGFINLVKAARILDTNGTTQLDPAGPGPSYTATPTGRAQPGQFVEYQITYQNISEIQPASGGGNVLLTANGLVINEDGAVAPNTWAGISTHRQNTAATLGTLQFYNGAVLVGSTDPASGAAVTRYVNTIPSLAPQVSGSLTFRRIVN